MFSENIGNTCTTIGKEQTMLENQ